MRTQRKKLLIKATTWLVGEIVLNLLGLDNWADYSEFVFEQEAMIASRPPHMMVVEAPPQQPQFNSSLPCPYTISPIAQLS